MIIGILIVAILIFLIILIYDPYIDIFEKDGKHNIVVWYTNLDNERNYVNILGG
jgi:hypothetical protein